jgi:hypothetical protein
VALQLIILLFFLHHHAFPAHFDGLRARWNINLNNLNLLESEVDDDSSYFLRWLGF